MNAVISFVITRKCYLLHKWKGKKAFCKNNHPTELKFYNEHVTMLEGSNLMTLEFAEMNSIRSKLNEKFVTCWHTLNFSGGPQA